MSVFYLIYSYGRMSGEYKWWFYLFLCIKPDEDDLYSFNYNFLLFFLTSAGLATIMKYMNSVIAQGANSINPNTQLEYILLYNQCTSL